MRRCRRRAGRCRSAPRRRRWRSMLAPQPQRIRPAAADACLCAAADGRARASSAGTGPDFSALERHLLKITSQIEALQRPDHIEQSIAAFRSELAEIRHAITEAMPRRAIESIENEIRSLSPPDRRKPPAAAPTARRSPASNARSREIREVLRSLTPAEQLTGYDDAIRNLGAKLDLILRANDDPSTVHQLEGAIAALALDRLQRRLQRRAGAAFRRRADAVGQGRPDCRAPAAMQWRCACDAGTAHRRADPRSNARSGDARAPGGEREFGTYRERAARAVRAHRPHAGRQRQ